MSMENHGGCGCGCGCGCGGAMPCDESGAGATSVVNRPGLPALAYRIGTHGAFLEEMIARLSSQDFPALARLTTRERSDPAIALLDSWALIGDVLTFYQERIANEGFLRTATERRSVVELARLLGYRPRPGVAASVYLAYTLDEDRSKTPPTPTTALIPVGSRVQSVPAGPGQLPQTFETSVALEARSEWNTLLPRLAQPQAFTLDRAFGTNALTRSAVYFRGTATNLNPGDSLLLVLSGASGAQGCLRSIQQVVVESAFDRTAIILQDPPLVDTVANDAAAAEFVIGVIKPFIQDGPALFPSSALADQATRLLSNPGSPTEPGLLEKLGLTVEMTRTVAAGLIVDTSPDLADLRELATARELGRLGAWLDQLLHRLSAAVVQLQRNADAGGVILRTNVPRVAVSEKGNSASLRRLEALLPALARPPSVSPRDPLALSRAVDRVFDASSDMGARLLGAFNPAATQLYRAWTKVVPARASAEVGAVRVKAGLFPASFPGPASYDAKTGTTSFDPPTIARDWIGTAFIRSLKVLTLEKIFLDSTYDKIVTGSWIVIERPDLTPTGVRAVTTHTARPAASGIQTLHQVVAATTLSRTSADGAFTAKITQLTIDPPWLTDLKEDLRQGYLNLPDVLTGTVVYAQSEKMTLADEPLDTDVAGGTIELDRAYDGLESGRWIIVAGERTDIPNVTGVMGGELAMIAGVAQAAAGAATRPGAVHTILTLASPLAYSYRLATVTLHGNVVKATHGETRKETLGSGDASRAFQQFALKQKPLTFVSAPEADGTASSLHVFVNDIEWHETDTMAALGPRDRSFVVATAEDDTVTVTFGNGRQGARLPGGVANIAATYRNGIGQPGNVAPEQITLLQSRPLNVKAVSNPLRASGGADRDDRDQVRRNAPIAVQALDRLVSVEDYAQFALTFAGVGKASAARLSDGRREVVHLTIAGVGDIPIDVSSDLYTNLGAALRANGDSYLALEIAVRRLRLLVVAARLKLLPDYQWEPVAAAVRTALLVAFGFDQRQLGQPVFPSEVISTIQGVSGVAYVDLDTFDSISEEASASDLSDLGSTLTLQQHIIALTARLNPQPAQYPLDAILPAELAYLSPALPDTIILNEITA